ncbi:MAG TPA: adenylate/guanylate cyclase domain-containing protein [Candidatus Limnocylindrales bacterium]|nr:adenylate/guanylate cyclase domain-containing protein [Candidatus Limnocylindrales bacterium]
MSRPPDTDPANEAFWRDFLRNPDTFQTLGRRLFSRIPADPRCRICAAPFAGPGAPVMRLIGKRPSSANPHFCSSCEDFMRRHRGGAEVEGSLLFADIRGSTSMAEGISATAFRRILDRFYTVASGVVFAHNGMVDKFVGDELVAVFPPVLNADRHAAHAVAAALALLRATGHADAQAPWVPVGAGVHTGVVWFGAIGQAEHVEITVVGDVVNTTARLAAQAATGEILVSGEAALAAGLDRVLERRRLELKGKQEAIEVVSLRVDSVASPS